MPVVLRFEGFKFFFYSNEGNPREPVHIHVRNHEGEAKFWIYPVKLASNYGFSDVVINKLSSVINQHQDLIWSQWHEYFGE